MWGATIDDEGRVRAMVSSHSLRTHQNVRPGAWLSLLFTDITTFVSVQVKGRIVGEPEAPGPAEVALLERYEETFGDALAQIGHPETLRDSLRPRSVFVLTVEMEEQFDQTPGPTAGFRVEATHRG